MNGTNNREKDYELPVPEGTQKEQQIGYGLWVNRPSREEIIRRNTITLARSLNYRCWDITHLEDAMCVDRIDDTARTSYFNSALATVGDTVLKAVIADELYHEDCSRGDITVLKACLESNSNLHRVSERLGLCHYAYNSDHLYDEAPAHEQLPHGKHDVYLEAVIGAVFHDLGFDGCREWVEREILPRLSKADNSEEDW